MEHPTFRLAFTLSILASVTLAVALAESKPEPLGVFDDHGDVGSVIHAGAAHFDRTRSEYTVTGSGDTLNLSGGGSMTASGDTINLGANSNETLTGSSDTVAVASGDTLTLNTCTLSLAPLAA